MKVLSDCAINEHQGHWDMQYCRNCIWKYMYLYIMTSDPVYVDKYTTKGLLCIPCFDLEAATKIKSTGKRFLE
jgi:hypothetical protein